MPVVNQTHAQKKQRADEQDLIKFKLEDKLAKNLDRLFKQISTEWDEVYTVTGQNIRMDLFTDDMNAVLKQSYRETSKAFRDDLKTQLEEQAESDLDNEIYSALLLLRNQAEMKIRADITAEMLTTVDTQTGFILGTTDNVIKKNTNNVIDEAIQAGKILTLAEIANEARKRINKDNANRSGGIAQNEVGNAAEGAKQTEAEVYQNSLDEGNVTTATGLAIFLIKTWITMGDSKVRTSHKIANKQKRKVRDPYVVQGQLLMRPKDSSLGATIDNIAKCRCESIIT